MLLIYLIEDIFFPAEGSLQSYVIPYPSICSHKAVVCFLHIFLLLRITPLLPMWDSFIKIMSHITPWILQLTKDHRALDKLEFQYPRSKSFKYYCSHFPGGLNWNQPKFTQVPTWKILQKQFSHKAQVVANTLPWLHIVPRCPKLERSF